jgi:hypothetical protein
MATPEISLPQRDLGQGTATQIWGIEGLDNILRAFDVRWLQTVEETHAVPKQQVVGTLYGPLEFMGKKGYVAMLGRENAKGEIDSNESIYGQFIAEDEMSALHRG